MRLLWCELATGNAFYLFFFLVYKSPPRRNFQLFRMTVADVPAGGGGESEMSPFCSAPLLLIPGRQIAAVSYGFPDSIGIVSDEFY